MKRRVAVIGAGIYGSTIALRLSSKNKVDLYEKEDDILKSTSSINEYRIHKGYHYPRSSQTAISSIRSELGFKDFYMEAIIDSRDNYYAIAKDGSLTSPESYLKFCKELNLKVEKVKLAILNNEKIALTLKVHESLYDPIILKELIQRRLKKNKVKVLLNTFAKPNIVNNYDNVIVCTYANSNQMFEKIPSGIKAYQFEVCEKPLVRLPKEFYNKSIVIMDGPFMCVDPYRNSTANFVMGNVVHAIHHANIGKMPEIPKKLVSLLNAGIIKNPSVTNFTKFIDSGSEFIPNLRKAKHIGSMYTVRTVLPNKERTDERPTIVKRINDKIISVFSGKISNCVEAANQIDNMINSNS